MTDPAEMQVELVDPRRYGSGRDDPLVSLAASVASGGRSAQGRLLTTLRDRVAAGDDAALEAAMTDAPGQRIRRVLLETLRAAIDDPAPDEADGLLTRVFAIPIVMVAGGRAGAVLSGLLPDVETICGLLRQHGALGQTENFGLASTLVTAEALSAVKPSVLYRWTRIIGDSAPVARGFEGVDIALKTADEQTYLRFLVGVGVASAQGLSFVESGSRIGAWGMAVARELAAQLGQEGLSLLPLPRPPKSLLMAAPAGRFAAEETRLSLFVSSVLRQLRASMGEPVAVISAHDGGELRIGLSSPFDTALLHGFRWPLGRFDDLSEVAASILSLLRDCRILDVRVVPGLQPERDPAGVHRALSIHDLGPSGEVRH
jgi:hypothetical protein